MTLAAQTPSIQWRKWTLIFAIAAAIQILLLLFLEYGEQVKGFLSPPIPVESYDSQALNRLKKQEQEFVQEHPSTLAPHLPKDARYFSKTNQTVEHETRASRRGGPAAQTRPPIAGLGVHYNFEAPAKDLRENQPGDSQIFEDSQAQVSAQNLLNTEESIYYSFYNRFYQVADPIFNGLIRGIRVRQPLQPKPYEGVMEVVIRPDGTLVDILVPEKSGVPEFDEAARETVRRVKTLRNPPKNLYEGDHFAHFRVHYRIDLNMTSVMQIERREDPDPGVQP